MGAQPFWNSETYVSVHGGIASVYPCIAVKCGKSMQIPHEASWQYHQTPKKTKTNHLLLAASQFQANLEAS